jgi:hypothetical protein
MQPTTVFLAEETQQTLQTLAEQQGKTINEVVQEAVNLYLLSAHTPSKPQSIDRRALMKLPLSERQRILAEQGDTMAQHYTQDTSWQEWVNFDLCNKPMSTDRLPI